MEVLVLIGCTQNVCYRIEEINLNNPFHKFLFFFFQNTNTHAYTKNMKN